MKGMMLRVASLTVLLGALSVAPASALLGTPAAIEHSFIGLLFATAMLEALFVANDRFPFACSYVPIQNPKVAWPAGLAGVLALTYGFAAVERWALGTAPRTIAFGDARRDRASCPTDRSRVAA
jgi:hypothetical protein